MRVKSQLWVQAYLRRCMSHDLPAMLVRRGQVDAGAIFIQINRLDGTCDLFGPAPAGLDDADTDRRWMSCFPELPVPERDAAAYLASQATFDPDFWLVEVEDAKGQHLLEDRVVES